MSQRIYLGGGVYCSYDGFQFELSTERDGREEKIYLEDRVLGAIASTGDRDLLTVETSRGAEQTISTGKYEVTGRGGKGRELLQRGQFTRILWPTPEPPPPLTSNS